MKNLKKGQQHILVLAVTYVLMLVLLVWLSVIKSSGGDNSGVIYSVILYVAVLVMYVYTILSFKRTDEITDALENVTEKMVSDYSEENGYLWNKYKEVDSLFEESYLDEQFRRFCKEQKRLALIGRTGSSYGNIEDYINYDLIDEKMHKNVLGIFPGTMTGLGILFTFFGLSICLQSFNTGSAADIMAGIDPLMGGLRVAFHTSIYGLIFSLVYNFCFKKILDDEYGVVDSFLTSFKEYVKPESEADVAKELVTYQNEQAKELAAISNGMSDAFARAIAPQFAILNGTITSFSNAASKVQTEGMKKMVAAFLKELNKSAGDSFNEIRDSITETCMVQGKYVSAVEKALSEITLAMQTASDASATMQKSIQEFDGYLSQMRELQLKLQENFESYTQQISDNNELTRGHQSLLLEVTEAQRTSGESLGTLVSEVQSCLTQLQDETRKFVISAEKANDNIIRNSTALTEKMDKSITATEQRMQQAEMDITNATRNSLQTITSSVDSLGQSMISQSNDHIQSIARLKEQISGDLIKSAEGLELAVMQLSLKVSDAISKGTSEYTDELRQTITDLNKTVREVRNTTGNVPRVISDADQTLEDAITKTEQSMNQLINGLEALMKKTFTRQEAIEREEADRERRQAEIDASLVKMQERQQELQRELNSSIMEIQTHQATLQESMRSSIAEMQRQQLEMQESMREFESRRNSWTSAVALSEPKEAETQIADEVSSNGSMPEINPEDQTDTSSFSGDDEMQQDNSSLSEFDLSDLL